MGDQIYWQRKEARHEHERYDQPPRSGGVDGIDARTAKYLPHLDRFDLSEHQKVELLRAVWQIMQSFVDRAFGDDPVQQVCKPEGNSGLNDDQDSDAMVTSVPTTSDQQTVLTTAFRDLADSAPSGENDKK